MGSNEKEDTVSVQNEAQKPLSRRLKILTTIVIFYGNMTYGCAMNAFSPALTDFKHKYDVDTETISVVFVASIACYMAGALTCSIIYNFINRQFAVSFLFVGITAVMFVVPHLPNLDLFYVAGGVLGFCIGCYDTAQFVWVMEMWQKDSGPLIQGQHTMFAVGTMLSPLIMAPFLTSEDEDDNVTTTPASDTESKIFIPFSIIGSLCAVTAVAQFLLFVFLRYRPPPPEVSVTSSENNNNEIKKPVEYEDNNTDNRIQRIIRLAKKQWPGWNVARLVILSMLTLGFYQGMEMSTMQLFPQFGQNCDLQLSEADSAKTLTGLTAAFTVSRALAIILIFKIPPQFILFTNIAIVAIGNVILVVWANNSLPMLWAAGLLYGFGFGSLLPSFCAYMERYLLFTDTIGAMMIVSGSLIGSIYPLIIGSMIDETPLVLSYPIFFSVGVCLVASLVAYQITRKGVNRVGE